MPKWPEIKKSAVALAKEGWEVFPGRMKDNSKVPLTKNGFHDASSNPAEVQKMNWDDADLILAAIPEGQFVVDIDPRSDGDKTFDALREAGLVWPSTRVHQTQGGGTHRFYALPDDVPADSRLRGKLGPGIDIKAAGKGYVVVPPSPGYTVKFPTPIKAAPAWMVEQLVKPENPTTENSVGGLPKFFDQWEAGTEYGTKALEGEIGRLLSTQEGGRNNALNRAAFSMAQLAAGGELSEAVAIEKLELAGERMGLDAEEVSQTVRSGWEAGLEQPREAPPKGQEDVPEGTTETTTFGQKEREFTPTESLFDVPDSEDESHFWLDWENADDSEPPFYLHPVIPKNAYVLVYGATEASKSMVFMALAAQASHKGIRSSIYSLENPPHIDIDRVRRLGPDGSNFRITNQMLDLNDPRQVHALIDREAEVKTDWLVLDTYSHAFNTRTEDGNAKAIEFARRIRFIMHKVGCSVILVDHTGYADHGEPRDASAKRQQVDMAIKMEKLGQWSPGAPSLFSMENKKSARFGNPFMLRGRIEDVKPGRGLKLTWDAGHAPRWDA